MIDTFLAKVTYVAPAAYDANGHLRTEATIKLDVYATKNSTAATPPTLTNGEDAYPYAVGDYVLLNAFTNAVNSATESGLIKTGADKYGEIVSKATSVDGAQTIIYWNNEQHNVEGTVYDDAVKFYLDQAAQKDAKYTWYFDSYNNLIGAVEIAAANSYGVINSTGGSATLLTVPAWQRPTSPMWTAPPPFSTSAPSSTMVLPPRTATLRISLRAANCPTTPLP